MALVLAGCATTGSTLPGAPKGPEVKDLSFVGNEAVSDSQLEKKILTSATGWLPFSTKKYFDPLTWQADLRRITRYYQARGHYQAEIVDAQVIPDGEDAVRLLVHIREGPPTRIAEIQLKGLESLPSDVRKRVRAQVNLKVGRIFEEAAWEQAKERLRHALRERGYAEAHVRGKAFVELDHDSASLLLNVKPGMRFKFGALSVSSGPKPEISPSVIIEEAQAALHPGAWFSETAMAEAQSRVFAMGEFSAVKVSPGKPDPSKGTVPVVISVREAPFHTVKAGGGIGIDPNRQEVRALAQYEDRDFFGGLRHFTARAKAGWAFLPSLYAVVTHDTTQVLRSEPIFTVSTTFEQPRFLFRDLRGQAAVSVEKGVEQAYQYIGGRLSVGVRWQPHPAFSVTPSYHLEAYRLRGEALLGGEAPTLAFGCPEPCVLSYLEQRVVWDRRDNRLEPTKGFYVALDFQEGGGPLGGAFDYVRIQPEVRWYKTFADRLTLAARLRVGTLLPASGQDADSPIISRFYLGGSDMRGFSYRRLSPMLAVRTDPEKVPLTAPIGRVEGKTVPIGGDGLVDGSLELRWRLSRRFSLAVFLDTGFVTTRHVNFGSARYFTSNLQYAVGIGLRYYTVIGPIRLDIARRLNIGPPLTVEQPPGQAVSYPTDSSCFGIGHAGGGYAGAPESPCNLEISIGEAF